MTNEELLVKLRHRKNKEGYSYLLDKEQCDICIKALEKQVGTKIEEHNKTCKCRVFDYMDYECTLRVPYCCVCGQKIDWSEADD